MEDEAVQVVDFGLENEDPTRPGVSRRKTW